MEFERHWRVRGRKDTKYLVSASRGLNKNKTNDVIISFGPDSLPVCLPMYLPTHMHSANALNDRSLPQG